MAVLILGDFYFGYDYMPDDIEQLATYIREHNFSVILNLEGAFTTGTDKIKKRGEHLRQSKLTIEVLKKLNVKGVTLANNHIYDYGEEGLLDTIRVLDENGIQHTGAGKNIEEAIKPIELIDDGTRYHFYAMSDDYEETICISSKHSSGCAPIQYEIAERFDKAANSVLIFHTGFEYNLYPMPRNIKQNRRFIELGAAAVICMHPHVVQPITRYKDRTIAYSLGNFYFSSFREEFSDKKLSNQKNGYCNIGYGIVLRDKQTEYVEIVYDPKDGESRFCQYSGPAITDDNGRTSVDYLIKCLRNRNNHNPILLGIRGVDAILLEVLHIMYAVYGRIKNIIKSDNHSGEVD